MFLECDIALTTMSCCNVRLVELPDFLERVRSGEMTDVEAAFLGLDELGLLASSHTA